MWARDKSADRSKNRSAHRLNWNFARVSKRVALIAYMLGSPLIAATAPAETPEDQPQAKDFKDAIAEMERIDPRAPAALASRLEYADFLAGSVSADCRARLDNVQSLLTAIAANPALDLLPGGRAHAAHIEYRLHLARASCGGNPPERDTELRKALAAALRAVDLYRDALDYQSMAVAQFNAGATHHILGEDEAAIASLETAVEMDREYGFHEDARDNGRLLMRWKRGDTGAADPSVTDPRDFPSRSAALKYGWIANDADIGIHLEYARLAGDYLDQAQGSGLVRQHIRRVHRHWVASYDPTMTADDADVRPDGAADLDKLAIIFTRALRQHPDIEVSDDGELQSVVDSTKVARRLIAGARALIRDRGSAGGAAARVPRNAAYETSIQFSPETVETKAAENYSLETGAWIGATLEQGVWYKMSAALTLPGIEQILLPHDMEFAYTRDVPCSAGSTTTGCVELVIHATPQEDALKELIDVLTRRLTLRRGQTARYWSTTYVRIVADPNTLETYVSDARRYWYLSTGEAEPNDLEQASERIVSTFAYH
jgi:tetratricopeptide (TPR) repeat protein